MFKASVSAALNFLSEYLFCKDSLFSGLEPNQTKNPKLHQIKSLIFSWP